MRRRDREITDRNEMESIINACHVCHLALCVENRPYAVALNYGYASGNPPLLYFHGARDGKKLDMIAQNPFVAFIIDHPIEIVQGETACGWGMKFESIMGEGRIEVLTNPEERIRGLETIMAQHGGAGVPLNSEAIKGTFVLKLSIETMTGKLNV